MWTWYRSHISAGRGTAISIVRESDDRLAGASPVAFAVDRLREALEANGARVLRGAADDSSSDARFSVLVAGATSAGAARFLADAGISFPSAAEAVGLLPDPDAGRGRVLACGSDERGLAYAVLELADRVRHAPDPSDALLIREPIVERPVNRVRSVARLFVSEPLDTPWFRDEGFWRRYLTMVVEQRFNRVNLMVGLGYNFPWHVTDGYLLFAYPFLVDAPGYRVRVPQLADGERERNLEMLRFASREAVARGLEFRLGLWTHAYAWIDSPRARHTIEGLDPEAHAPYCRDALRALLEACPDVGGITLRTHGESGVPERSWAFWRTVFDGVASAGRPVEIDLHAKGLDRETLDLARATGMPVTVSPKYAAEHMGLPYHQAAMREQDRPALPDVAPGEGKARYMTVSEGSRPFTRYGYGDFLREDRDYDVVFRIWPGTQRVLLWGDPALAAGVGRHASLAGSQGFEWCEPLSLRGREGTGAGPRDGYADRTLSTEDDWEKHAQTFRLFGRLGYRPDADPDVWRRSLRTSLGASANAAGSALASASRILPLVTTAHHPSASNNFYWPEIYTDLGIVGGEDGSVETAYYDTPLPKRFGTAVPLDPEIFTGVEEAIEEAADGRPSGRYTPLHVAAWLERLADDALERLEGIRGGAAEGSAALRRLLVDAGIQARLGRFFAGKLRAATFHEVARRTGSRSAAGRAIQEYRGARVALADAAALASGVYVDDLAFGPQPWLRGSWADRLPAVDADLARMIAATDRLVSTPGAGNEARRLVSSIAFEPRGVVARHRPRPTYEPGEPFRVELAVRGSGAGSVTSVSLRHRAVDQSRTWAAREMSHVGSGFEAVLEPEDVDPAFALQYLFVVRDGHGHAWLHPGLDPALSGQPYHVVRRDGSG